MSIDAGTAPLSVGAGTFAQEFPFGAFQRLNETNGLLAAQSSACQGFNAADTKPDGRVVAVSINSSVVSEIDVNNGTCRDLFIVPEPMTAIAVASNGTIKTISYATLFGARQVYRFNSSGTQLGKAPLTGYATYLLSGDPAYLGAVDFAPDGSLYATTNNGSIWLLDSVTGVSTLKANLIAGTGDIDIDSSGMLRTIHSGSLKVISTTSWSVISTQILAQDIFAFSALVRR